MARCRDSSCPSGARLWFILGLALMITTHHQAAAQATTPTPGAAATTATIADGSTTAAATTAPLSDEAAAFKSMATQLAETMSSTLSNPVANGPMAQSTADFLKSLNLGDNLQGLMDGSWKDALGSVGGGKLVSDADLFNAFDGLKSTAKGLGMVLPTDSVGNWSALAQAATDANTVKDFLTVLPVLLKVGGKAGTLPAAARTAVNTLKNLAIDALESSGLAAAALVSLGLGLGASVVGIVGGALFIAGASVLLGAGVDSIDTDALDAKYGNNAYIKDFVDLARTTSSTVLPQALQGVYAIDPLDFGLQVLQTTVDVVGGGPLAAGA